MTALVVGAVRRATAELDHARSRLRLLTPAAQIEQGALRVDDLVNRLAAALRHSMQSRRQMLAEVRSLLGQRSPERRVQQESHHLLSLWKRLQAASPRSVLNRGFVMLRDDAGKPVTRAANVKVGGRLEAEFADGVRPMRVE
jgi:exodeoxyribonuclease VII large subunit